MSRYDYMVNLGMFTGTKFEVLTITTAAATGLSSSVYPSSVMRALITSEGGDLRYRYDGIAPTASTGHLLSAGAAIEIVGPANVPKIKLIATSGTGIVYVTYEAQAY